MRMPFLVTGTSWLTLTAADAAGNASSTNIAVVQSSVLMSIDPYVISSITDQTSVYVGGTVSAPGYSVWVNGVEATNLYGDYDTNEFPDDYMYWCAVVPVNSGGTALFEALAIPNGDASGYGLPGAVWNGGRPTLQNPGNPVPHGPCPVLQAEQDKLPCIVYSEIHANCIETNAFTDLSGVYPTCPIYNSWKADWTNGSGGNCLFSSWSEEFLYVYDFGWSSSDMDAFGNCITHGGGSPVFGDYSVTNSTYRSHIGDPCNPLSALTPWSFDALTGVMAGLGAGNNAVGGWTTDCETSGAQVDSADQTMAYYAVTDRCVAIQAYVPNGKGVPVQSIVAFNVRASGAQPEYHPNVEGNLIYCIAGGFSPTPASGMTVAGVVPGADGIAYKVVPSGVPMVILGPDFETGPAGTSGTGFQAMATQAPSSQASAGNSSYKVSSTTAKSAPLQFYFYQQRGAPATVLSSLYGGIGTWGQPWETASGNYTNGGSFGTSTVCVYGLDFPGFAYNDCNTISEASDYHGQSDAGSLLLYLQNALPGTYRVLLSVTIYSHVYAASYSTAGVTWEGAIPNNTSIHAKLGSQLVQTSTVITLPISSSVTVSASQPSALVAYTAPVVVVHTTPGSNGYSAARATTTITVEGYYDPNGVFHKTANYKHAYGSSLLLSPDILSLIKEALPFL